MASYSAERDEFVAKLVTEITAAVDRVGELEAWAAGRCDGSVGDVVLQRACSEVAEGFLSADPPQTGRWEHFLVTLALHSGHDRHHRGLHACESVVNHLSTLLEDDRLKHFPEPKLMTLASALTVALAVEAGVTQEVEQAMRLFCDRYPNLLPEVADECQDIWKRRGQMSARPGLFLWDERRNEWRLAQDFKPYRPGT